MLRLGVAVLLALGASSSYAAQLATHAAVSCAGLPATIVGTAQADELQGTEAPTSSPASAATTPSTGGVATTCSTPARTSTPTRAAGSRPRPSPSSGPLPAWRST